jgi:uncharacterized membrane protein YfcA
LARLAVPVIAGVLVGVVFLRFVDDAALRVSLGIILLGLVAFHLVNQVVTDRARRARVAATAGPPGAGPSPQSADADPAPEHHMGATKRSMFGGLAGFTTMVANAGGAPMSLYLLEARFAKMAFLGTVSWFFFFVNIFKLPFSISLGLVTAETLPLWAVLIPAVLVGTWVGRVTVAHINQKWFNICVLASTAVAAVILLF